jgi:hypothetical protein
MEIQGRARTFNRESLSAPRVFVSTMSAMLLTPINRAEAVFESFSDGNFGKPAETQPRFTLRQPGKSGVLRVEVRFSLKAPR